MALVVQLFRRGLLGKKSSSKLIAALILIAAQVLPCQTAEPNCIFIHWDESDVKVGGNYNIDVRLEDDTSYSPQQPFKCYDPPRDLHGKVSVTLESKDFTFDPISFDLTPKNNYIERPRFTLVTCERHAKMNICLKDEGENSETIPIIFSVAK